MHLSLNAGRTRWIVLLSIVAFVVVNAGNALHKGGDATDFFQGGSDALHGRPLYSQSGPASGFIGPPFQALFFAPFAALAGVSDAAARLGWYAINLTLLGAGLVFWRRVCLGAAALGPGEAGPDARDVAAALLAVLLPLQTNFEHQNMNALLLGFLGIGTYLLIAARPVAAGVLFGCAAALKVFPAAVIVYLAARRQWRAFGAGLMATVTLTALPIVVNGPAAYWRDLTAWLSVSSGGWPIRGNNQALIAAVDRLTFGWDSQGLRTAADAPVAAVLTTLLIATMVGVGVFVYVRLPWRVHTVPIEITSVVVLSVVCSPIAWDHYWTLAFPAFYLIRRGSHPALLGKAGTVVFWVTALLVTGFNRATVGAGVWDLTRKASTSTIAAVVMYFALLALARAVARQRGALRTEG